MISIIVVEDNIELRDELVFSLTENGVQVSAAADSAGLYRLILQNPADIVVLDLGLPNEDGISIIRHLRSVDRTRGIGIILITGSRTTAMHLKSLEAGADVFLQKPFNPEVLRTYVMSLYRRVHCVSAEQEGRVWRFRASELKLHSPSGRTIELTFLESLFIQIIARHAGKPVKRRDIIADAFGKDPLMYDTRCLEAIVGRLRKKIHRAYPLAQPIQVAHSFGYLFAAPIECD